MGECDGVDVEVWNPEYDKYFLSEINISSE